MSFVCFNGRLYPSDQPLFTAQNRSFKYGDGLFETIKVYRGNILLQNFHFLRLFQGLQFLKINVPADFTEQVLADRIIELCRKNKCSELARVRLAVYRNDQNLCEYCIEALPLSIAVHQWSTNWTIDLYPYARKSQDAFSNLKNANFLPYIMAAKYAEEKGIDDCIVLNADNCLCDSSKANIFLVRDGKVFTPSLDQGCISGVMRHFIIEELKKLDYPVHQKQLKEEDLLQADEVFLTNAIMGMKGVKAFRSRFYTDAIASDIYHKVFSTIYS